MRAKVLGLCAVCFFICAFSFPQPASAGEAAYWRNSFSLRAGAAEWQADLSPPLKKSGKGSLPLPGFSDFRNSVLLGLDEKASPPGGPAKDDPQMANFRYTVGIPFLSLPIFEWAKYNRYNQFIGFRGINYGLGYQSKNYFNPPKLHAWNSFWQWGTVYLLIPYVGVGTEFTTNHIYFEIATFYIVPYISLGVHF